MPTDARARTSDARAAGSDEDRRLIARCQQGDKRAFDDLMRRHERKVYNFAFRLCGRYDEANDIAADTFVRVYNALPNFRGDSSFITWLFRIATNVYLDDQKKKRNRPVQSLQEIIDLEETSVQRQVEDPSPGPEATAELKERGALLQDAIKQLPDYQRMMIVMYHSEGRSYEEIADTLELPIGTVKSRLNRARLTLRQLLTPVKEHFKI